MRVFVSMESDRGAKAAVRDEIMETERQLDAMIDRVGNGIRAVRSDVWKIPAFRARSAMEGDRSPSEWTARIAKAERCGSDAVRG